MMPMCARMFSEASRTGFFAMVTLYETFRKGSIYQKELVWLSRKCI